MGVESINIMTETYGQMDDELCNKLMHMCNVAGAWGVAPDIVKEMRVKVETAEAVSSGTADQTQVPKMRSEVAQMLFLSETCRANGANPTAWVNAANAAEISAASPWFGPEQAPPNA